MIEAGRVEPGEAYPPAVELKLGRQKPMLGDLPPTRTSRSKSGVDPRMSSEDQSIYTLLMREHPHASPEDVVKEILKERGFRGGQYARGEQ
jgi:hypothetical protein